ncbi:tRNA uridine-5-carboxymethylaminomethyl(34) synthesis enzyme MnmG, partial [Escherichia coli]|nr:tRNA uridine-5-carboxymethylaminomethyl(34) synthesis enzyme MnmG [Escherichia coli]
TSRAEFRLSLRADNADQRLTPTGLRLGLVGGKRQVAFEAKLRELEGAYRTLSNLTFSARELRDVGITVAEHGPRRSAVDV